MDEISNKKSNSHDHICKSLFNCFAIVAHGRCCGGRRRHALAMSELHQFWQEDGKKEINQNSDAIHLLICLLICSQTDHYLTGQKVSFGEEKWKKKRWCDERKKGSALLIFKGGWLLGGLHLVYFSLLEQWHCHLENVLNSSIGGWQREEPLKVRNCFKEKKK